MGGSCATSPRCTTASRRRGVSSLAQEAAAALGPQATLRATKAFRRADRNDSGDIDCRELRPLLRDVGLEATESQVLGILAQYDLDGDATIDLPEFLALVRDVTAYKDLVAKAEASFRRHDRDGSGGLDQAELLGALREIGLDPSRQHVRATLAWYDTDGSRRVEMREFLLLVQDVRDYQEAAARAERLFRAHDRDRSGFIERRELGAALRALGVDPTAQEVADVLARYDRDGNARLDLREFLLLFRDIKRHESEQRRPKAAAREDAAATAAAASAAPMGAAMPAPREAEDDIERIFNQFDDDNSRSIDRGELKQALKSLGMEVDNNQAAGVLAKYDADGSGTLRLDEFRRLVGELRAFQEEQAAAPPPTPPPTTTSRASSAATTRTPTAASTARSCTRRSTASASRRRAGRRARSSTSTTAAARAPSTLGGSVDWSRRCAPS